VVFGFFLLCLFFFRGYFNSATHGPSFVTRRDTGFFVPACPCSLSAPRLAFASGFVHISCVRGILRFPAGSRGRHHMTPPRRASECSFMIVHVLVVDDHAVGVAIRVCIMIDARHVIMSFDFFLTLLRGPSSWAGCFWLEVCGHCASRYSYPEGVCIGYPDLPVVRPDRGHCTLGQSLWIAQGTPAVLILTTVEPGRVSLDAVARSGR